MAEKFDLQIKRELLDSSFDGYKLSLDSLPTYSLQLGIGKLLHDFLHSTFDR